MAGITNKEIYDGGVTALVSPAADLRAKLATDAKGPEDLMEISYLLSNYTLTVQLRTTMLKEQTDTMKGVIQKI